MMKWFYCLVILFVVGCTSSNGVTRYDLPTSDQPQPLGAKRIRVIVSNELDYKNIIYRTSETEIIRAKQHLWVEDLQTLLEGKLSQNLNSKSPYQLEFKIERFNGSFTGNAEIVGQWRYIDRKGEIAADGDFYKQVPLANEGYQALVDALGKGFDQVYQELSLKEY